MNDNLQITIQKNIYGIDCNYMLIGLAKGKKLLLSAGYNQCDNKTYYQKNDSFWHWNHISKCWYNN